MVKVSPKVKDQISQSILGRILSPDNILLKGVISEAQNLFIVMRSLTGKILMEFKGFRIAARDVGLNNIHLIIV
jgi:hypothetical protein